MNFDVILGIIIPIATASGGWAFKRNADNVKEAKADALEAKQTAELATQALQSVKELIIQRFDSLDEKQNERHAATEYRLQRVEKSLNGYLRHEDHNSVN